MNFTAILSLYFLGLLLLLVADFLGATLLKFKKSNQFIQLFLGYLTLIGSYAVVKGSGNSIGVFVLFWVFGYLFFIKQEESFSKITRIDYFKNLGSISFLWTIVFLLKVTYFWNFDYNCPNLPFVDYSFYMKIAEGYHLSGHENAMGLRNLLFPFLDFAQPYRSSDFWLVSLGLNLTPFATIYVWELFYSTILIFVCAFSLFEVLKRKFNFYVSLFLAVLILFAFSGQWYRDLINIVYSPNPGSFDPIGIIAYTKLALVFSVLFQFYFNYEMAKKIEAIYLLILIPLLVQSAIAFFVLSVLIIVYNLTKNKTNDIKRHIPLILIFLCLVVGVFIFYSLNLQKEQLYSGISNLNISNNDSLLNLIVQFFKKSTLMFISYFWLSMLIVMLLLFFDKSLAKGYRIEFGLVMIFCFFSSTLVYAIYNKMGDSYQFSTNVFGPFVLSLMIYLFINTSLNSVFGKAKIVMIMLISILGVFQIFGGNNVFHSTTRIQYFDKKFISLVKETLPQLKYPLGIIYYGENLQDQSKEDFPLHDAAFLKLFGRNYDVFNIEADSLKINRTDASLQKLNASISRNALNIWIKNTKKTAKFDSISNREQFYKSYPFSFCISRKPKDSLPNFIKIDVEKVIKDKNSKVYFYTLERNANQDN